LIAAVFGYRAALCLACNRLAHGAARVVCGPSLRIRTLLGGAALRFAARLTADPFIHRMGGGGEAKG
jgi:hypothetical protein